MYVFSSNDFIEMLPILFTILIIFFAILLLAVFISKKQDDKKELVTCKVKILEKPYHKDPIAWYIVECENGERLKLRSFHADSLIITVGDVGIMEYKGSTIQSFHR